MYAQAEVRSEAAIQFSVTGIRISKQSATIFLVIFFPFPGDWLSILSFFDRYLKFLLQTLRNNNRAKQVKMLVYNNLRFMFDFCFAGNPENVLTISQNVYLTFWKNIAFLSDEGAVYDRIFIRIIIVGTIHESSLESGTALFPAEVPEGNS